MYPSNIGILPQHYMATEPRSPKLNFGYRSNVTPTSHDGRTEFYHFFSNITIKNGA
jgi:hypothetical protein